MHLAQLASETDFEGWREAARDLCRRPIPPDAVEWSVAGASPSLFGGETFRIADKGCVTDGRRVSVSRRFISLARRVTCHSDPQRFARLYTLLFRMQGRPNLLDNPADEDVRWLLSTDKAIRRDVHKFHAFVRFRKVGECADGREQFAAWFEPTHFTTELSAPFFQRRFPNMDWLIVTPHRSAIWNGRILSFGAGGRRSDVPAADAVEDQWRAYFQSIFNPARLKIGAMLSEMPKKYWRNMPEAALIPGMIKEAQCRTNKMQASAVTPANPLADRLADRTPETREAQRAPSTLAALEGALDDCRRCPLYRDASQAVPGEGPLDARLMIVGEQPGDAEDIAGQPFVGPAGQLLDDALLAAGIDRTAAYVTNAVKHFKFKTRGKRRIHARPRVGEIDACRWWLDIERELIRPDMIIALGATAARGLLGRSVKVSDVRGKTLTLPDGAQLMVTIHPSYLLRLGDLAERRLQHSLFLSDLKLAQSRL